MKMKPFFLLTLVVSIFLFPSCKKKISGDNVKFVVPQQGLFYSAAEHRQTNDSTAWKIELADINNVTEYKEANAVIHLRIDDTGRFTYVNPNERLVLYELLAFSVLPAQGTKITKGTQWTTVRPTDAEALRSTAIVGQEKIDYEVMEVDDDHVLVKTTGSARIAPSAGLDSMLVKMGAIPGVFNPSMLQYQPYASGTANFNIGKSCVSKAEGTRIPFGYLLPAPNLSTSPGRVNYSITLN
jgi:hypothetical protein